MRILSEIRNVTMIASGRSVKARHMLRKRFGAGHWRKMKGLATVELDGGTICTAEVHWYEAHGVGQTMFKIKRVVQP